MSLLRLSPTTVQTRHERHGFTGARLSPRGEIREISPFSELLVIVNAILEGRSLLVRLSASSRGPSSASSPRLPHYIPFHRFSPPPLPSPLPSPPFPGNSNWPRGRPRFPCRLFSVAALRAASCPPPSLLPSHLPRRSASSPKLGHNPASGYRVHPLPAYRVSKF